MEDVSKTSLEKASTIRIIDANRNRAVEAARVIEEFCRFHLESEMMTTACKELRHAVTAVTTEFFNLANSAPFCFRETDEDIGTRINASDELDRDSLDHIVTANFSRLQESLRSLEEYSKVISPNAAAQFESIRYESYQLQKSLFHIGRANDLLADCRICVLTDGADSIDLFESHLRLLIGASVDMIQLRDKSLESRDLISRARLLKRLTADTETICIINDRPDICLISGADGVHVGQDDASVSDARKIVGDRLVGVSTHSLEQAAKAVRDGGDYIGIGPMFASQTKDFDELQGCRLLEEVADQIPLPGFAIGGIDVTNISEIVASGGKRVAISGAVWSSDNPVEVISEIRSNLSLSIESEVRGGLD